MPSKLGPSEQDKPEPFSTPEWYDYQEQVAEHFRNIGLSAETNVTLRGVRTTHDIDVVVRSEHVGFDLLWLVECKSWRRPVSKVHVLALREIVMDLGADRGILMAESGFQQGAYEASILTNVQLTSLQDLVTSSSEALGMARLRELQRRVDECKERYWSLSNNTREENDLHPPAPASGYSGGVILLAVNITLQKAFSGNFPIDYHPTYSALEAHGAQKRQDDEPYHFIVNSASELADRIEEVIEDLEQRIDTAERAQRGASRASGD